MPEDFGSHEYFKRRKNNILALLDKISSFNYLSDVFEAFLPSCRTTLLDYLWVNDEDVINLTRKAIKIIPPEKILSFVLWTINDFWRRYSGWPDLLAFKDNEYIFIEVKSPHDKLSLDQMNWFRWAINEMSLPCEICRVKKLATDN